MYQLHQKRFLERQREAKVFIRAERKWMRKKRIKTNLELTFMTFISNRNWVILVCRKYLSTCYPISTLQLLMQGRSQPQTRRTGCLIVRPNIFLFSGSAKCYFIHFRQMQQIWSGIFYVIGENIKRLRPPVSPRFWKNYKIGPEETWTRPPLPPPPMATHLSIIKLVNFISVLQKIYLYPTITVSTFFHRLTALPCKIKRVGSNRIAFHCTSNVVHRKLTTDDKRSDWVPQSSVSSSGQSSIKLQSVPAAK